MLTRITTPRVIRSFKVYDLEWIPGTLKVRLVGVFDGERYRCYSSVTDFLRSELTHQNRGKWYYAHAGGLADIQFVLADLLKQIRSRFKLYTVRAAFSSSSAIITRISDGHNSFAFVDSYWLLRDKLKNIAKSLGMVKGEGTGYAASLLDPDAPDISDEEYHRRKALIRDWYATASFAELRDYNEQDCRILWTAIDRFESELLELGGQLQMTVASCGMHLIRRKYLTRNIPTSNRVNYCAQQAYSASRVEDICLEPSIAHLYLDINSSFPFSMKSPLPGQYVATVGYLPERDVLYLADVEIEVTESYLPPLPFRHLGRIFFPVGRWRAWFTSIDVEALQDRGGIVHRVHEVLLFEEWTDLRYYVDDIYSRRKATKDPFKKIVYKYMLNAPYGKFAESPWKKGLAINPDNRTKWMTEMSPGIFFEERKVPIPHAHVPVSAHITARSRLLLLQHMEACNEVYYCDTDGFATDTELATGPNIGDLKLEKFIDEDKGRYYAPKFYEQEGTELKDGVWTPFKNRKLKGFSGIRSDHFEQLLEGRAIGHERMRRIRENFRSGQYEPSEDTVYKRVKVLNPFDPTFDTKPIHLPPGWEQVGLGGGNSYPKRFQYPDGTTRAWHVDEIRENVK